MRAVKVLDGDRPVMVISFRTQQMTLIRDAKSGDIVQGDAEKLEKFGYQWALTLDEGAWMKERRNGCSGSVKELQELREAVGAAEKVN